MVPEDVTHLSQVAHDGNPILLSSIQVHHGALHGLGNYHAWCPPSLGAPSNRDDPMLWRAPDLKAAWVHVNGALHAWGNSKRHPFLWSAPLLGVASTLSCPKSAFQKPLPPEHLPSEHLPPKHLPPMLATGHLLPDMGMGLRITLPGLRVFPASYPPCPLVSATTPETRSPTAAIFTTLHQQELLSASPSPWIPPRL